MIISSSKVVQGLFKSSSIIVLLLICCGVAYSADYRCGGDLNGDGMVDPQTETQVCTRTQQGYLCPIQQTACQVTSVDPQCPSGMTFNSKSNRCESRPTNGQCPFGYRFDSSSGNCIYCPPFTGCRYACAKNPVCPAGSTYLCTTLVPPGSFCVASPQCPSGTTYNSSTKKCESMTCPLGSYPCMYSNGWYCSPYTCVDISNPSNVETDQAGLGSYTNDGTYDPQTGQCQGQIYIFNGTAGECRPPGTQTLFHNCCECETDPQCKPSEQTTSCAVSRGSTHYIGEYCKEKWKLIGCVQKAKVYCIFQSKLARIIQEQGRLQLIAFSPDGQWGTPKSPNCRGFTPEEFQALDFSKIDLSEYLNDMVQQSQQQIQQLQQNLSNTITQGIENIQPH